VDYLSQGKGNGLSGAGANTFFGSGEKFPGPFRLRKRKTAPRLEAVTRLHPLKDSEARLHQHSHSTS